MNPRERDFIAKKEGKNDPKIRPSSRQWSSHKNPRIVRVSRTFGGKDRHSKVCTVRGLRDRRIRLSVPTAVQLYDLQDRLGVGQPSKVVDWLLNATKNDIDKLPPLPMLPEEFSQSSSNINPGIVQENQEGFVAQNQLLFQNQFGFPNMPYNWDLPSLSLSHIGGGGYHLPNQSDVLSHNNLLPSNSQLYFPPYFNPLMDSLQNPLLPTTLHLISPPLMKPFYVNANSKTGHWQQNDNERREKKERS